jgi:hypothetical protein
MALAVAGVAYHLREISGVLVGLSESSGRARTLPTAWARTPATA